MSFSRIHITDTIERYEVEVDMIGYAKSFYHKSDTVSKSGFFDGRSDDTLGRLHEMEVDIRGDIEDIRYFLFWYDECVSEIVRFYREKSINMSIFVYFIGRNLTADDTTKNRGHNPIIGQIKKIKISLFLSQPNGRG
jgi:hypothetical protein